MRITHFDSGAPRWWDWEVSLSRHLRWRMEDRGFNEVELREMLERAGDYRQDVVEGRWIIETAWRDRPWEVIVEPDENRRLLVVVTAYAVDGGS